MKAAARALYRRDPAKKKVAVKGKKKAAAKALYHADPDKKRAASRVYYTALGSGHLESTIVVTKRIYVF